MKKKVLMAVSLLLLIAICGAIYAFRPTEVEVWNRETEKLRVQTNEYEQELEDVVSWDILARRDKDEKHRNAIELIGKRMARRVTIDAEFLAEYLQTRTLKEFWNDYDVWHSELQKFWLDSDLEKINVRITQEIWEALQDYYEAEPARLLDIVQNNEDFSTKQRTERSYDDGWIGWSYGEFHDIPGGYVTTRLTDVYFKGDKIASIDNDVGEEYMYLFVDGVIWKYGENGPWSDVWLDVLNE